MQVLAILEGRGHKKFSFIKREVFYRIEVHNQNALFPF